MRSVVLFPPTVPGLSPSDNGCRVGDRVGRATLKTVTPSTGSPRGVSVRHKWVTGTGRDQPRPTEGREDQDTRPYVTRPLGSSSVCDDCRLGELSGLCVLPFRIKDEEGVPPTGRHLGSGHLKSPVVTTRVYPGPHSGNGVKTSRCRD